MKAIYSLCIIFLLAGATYAQLINGGFEQWANGSPVGWTTPNLPGRLILVEEATHVHQEGHSSARLLITTTAPRSFVSQGIVNVATDSVNLGIYYGEMSDSMLGTASIIGWVNGETRDAGATTFVSQGAEFNSILFRWYPHLRSFDSLVVIISASNSGVNPRNASVLIDAVEISGVTELAVKDSHKPILLPATPSLIGIYPNPFNSDAAIRYNLPVGLGVLSLYDGTGRLISRMILAGQTDGEVRWSAIAGRKLPAGRYTFLLKSISGSTSLAAVYLK
jgi:hypothetical protein